MEEKLYFVIVDTSTLSVWSVVDTFTQALQVLNDAPWGEAFWLRFHKFKCPNHIIADPETMNRLERQRYLSDPLTLIPLDTFYEMLKVLPPVGWKQAGGLDSFFMSERLASTFTMQYARRLSDNQCFGRVVDLSDRSTWITLEQTHDLLAAYSQTAAMV